MSPGTAHTEPSSAAVTGSVVRPARAFHLAAAGCTDRGAVRPTNQDCYRVDVDGGMLLVADGMGGHAGGDVASRMAAATVIECLRDPFGRSDQTSDPWPFGFDRTLSDAANRLRTAFHTAHLRLLEAALLDPALSGMGTTLVTALEQEGCLTVAWAGDSRLYVRDDGGLRQITKDDSWLEQALQDSPDAGPDELAFLHRHPLRHALTNVVGTSVPTQVHIAELPVTPGMVVLLTTDGVHGALDLDEMAAPLVDDVLPQQAAAALVGAAIEAGSTDNCTAVVGRFTC